MVLDIGSAPVLRCSVALPASKSMSNRALAIQALSGNKASVHNLSDCDDTRAMLRAMAAPEGGVIDIGAAGTAMRFSTAFLASTGGEHLLTGSERMRHRPIGLLVEALRELGADVSYAGEEGFPPLRIRGHALEGGSLSLPSDVSSQYVSALLLVAPTMARGLRLSLTGETLSRPYIDMTLALMRQSGAEAEWTAPSEITVRPVAYRPTPYYIEPDWSAASYWYEMVALSRDTEARVVLEGLTRESVQGDSAARDIFARLGVKTTFTSEGAVLTKTPDIAARLDWNMQAVPDLGQTVVATAAALGVPFRLSGLTSLRIKETDRIAALTAEMAKLGVRIAECQAGVLTMERQEMRVDAGGSTPVIATYDDHRMALAFAPLALRTGRIAVADPEVVSKSYPRYWDDLAAAGFTLTRRD